MALPALRYILVLLVLLLCSSYSAQASITSNTPIFDRAQKGDVNAQSYIAHLYATGTGVPRDYAKAKYWYQRIVDHKGADAKIVAHANLLLGIMYNTGKGTTRSYEKAMKCYKIAASQGYFDAHISIGHLYAQGLGVQQDFDKALYWWELAQEKGHPNAANLVAFLKKEIRNKADRH